MNFFDVQDRARRRTRRLVVLYLLATSTIVAGVSLLVAVALFNTDYLSYRPTFGQFLSQQAPVLLGAAVVTTLFIIGATLVKTAQLSSGGGRVAQQLGGTLVSPASNDPLQRRLRNVVEEMAIASGVPVPEIYVLEQEPGINAFAAGFAPGDAAVAVTRGALEMLDRDELQGVIGHEFSHILNGDMRLNIRLMGVLFGIMALGLMGRMILRGGRYSGFASRRGKGAPAALVIGLGLAILGSIGVFFARLIKSGVSRQREFLADASAVQFTRNTSGLANALKKIGGFDAGSHLQATDPEEISHMLFGTGSKLGGLFATHPPLIDRIRALDPGFRPGEFQRVSLRERDAQGVASSAPQHAAFAPPAAAAQLAPAAIIESVGQPTDVHVAFAARIRRSLPAQLYDAAHSAELSYLLAVALVLDRDGRLLQRQLAITSERLGVQRSRMVREFYDALQTVGPEYRLPLLEIAFAALRRRPAPQLGYLIELAGRLIEVDGEIDLYEFCFYRVLTSNLRHVIEPGKSGRQRRAGQPAVRDAAVTLLRIAAHYGHDNDVDGAAAFRAGLQKLGIGAHDLPYSGARAPSVALLEKSLDLLVALNAAGRAMLLDAVAAVALYDSTLIASETELLRAICASLEIPLPPQIGVSLDSISIPVS